jgi:hypothetical protein
MSWEEKDSSPQKGYFVIFYSFAIFLILSKGSDMRISKAVSTRTGQPSCCRLHPRILVQLGRTGTCLQVALTQLVRKHRLYRTIAGIFLDHLELYPYVASLKKNCFLVLRIRDAYPGSRILTFPSRILDPGLYFQSRIQDPDTQH